MATLESWRPSVQDVANLVPNRPGVTNAGVRRVTFDAETTPTAAQVEGLIRGVQNEVVPQVGTMPDALTVVPSGGTIGESAAGHVVALGAASLVESQFYPDQQLGMESPAARLETWYREALKALVKAANEIGAGADPGDQPKPVGAFPAAVAYGLATTPWEQWHHRPMRLKARRCR